MSTMQAMIAEIETDTERSDTDAIRTKILAAIRTYQKRRFWFNESRDVTFGTTSGQSGYDFATIGTEFYAIDLALLITSGKSYELTPTNYTALEGADPQFGVPSYYAYVNRALRLWQTPDSSSYAVRLSGHIKLDAPASDPEANNAWMTEAYDLIMAHAKSELYAHRWEDERNAAIQQTIVREKLRDLTFATNDKVAPGYLELTDF